MIYEIININLRILSLMNPLYCSSPVLYYEFIHFFDFTTKITVSQSNNILASLIL